jgi:hypothetical protein
MLRFAVVAVLCSLALLASAVLLSSDGYGQATTGTPNFSAFDGDGYEVVDLLSNTIVLNVPVRSEGAAYPALASRINRGDHCQSESE